MTSVTCVSDSTDDTVSSVRGPTLLLSCLFASCGSSETHKERIASVPSGSPSVSAVPSASASTSSAANVVEAAEGRGRRAYVSRAKLPKGPWRAFAHRARVSCGLREDETLACFDDSGRAVADAAPSGTFRKLVMAQEVGCAISTKGLVRCFGTREPLRVPALPDKEVRDISLSDDVLCWVDAKGGIGCSSWGPNTPAEAEKPRGTFQSISCTGRTCCALGTNGELQCFGERRAVFDAPTGRYRAFGIDGQVGCAIDEQGALQCWGANGEVPKTLPKGTFEALHVTSWKSCAIRRDKSAVCFGRFSPRPTERPKSRAVEADCGVDESGEIYCDGADFFGPIPEGQFTDIVAGNDIACAIDAAGATKCWGETTDVVLGVPKTGVRALDFGSVMGCALDLQDHASCWGSEVGTPPSGLKLASLAVGPGSCALDPGGRAQCWGKLKQKPPGGPLLAIAVGETNGCALSREGRITCFETYGAIGDHGPMGAPPSGSFTSIFVGYEHACALDAAGKATCWGRDVAEETHPPKDTFKSLTLGEKRTCGLHPDGTAVCWGGSPATPPQDIHFRKIALTTDNDLQTPTFVCGLAEPDSHVECWAYEL